jgi:S-DNA-T family DNA segregation ATPase FtsK/SpoIIIE
VDHCAECGFTYAAVAACDIPDRLVSAAARFAETLARVPDPRRRPGPQVWSALEYTCHVRDVLRVQTARLALALNTDNPPFAPMGRDELALYYHTEDPQTAAAELAAAATVLAEAFAALTPGQWTRTGVYNWPAVAVRTVLWLGRHTLHELQHHRMDVTRQES